MKTGEIIGPYRVVAKLGAGGMGEVYRARDPKLARDVAIKVLPELFAADPDRVARFEREAQSLAAVSHPNIAQVFGIIELPGETSHRGVGLVMELVEGEDLAQRLSRGALPLDDALAVARQIAEGLEAAHERGIIHRDLKPANVKVRSDGTVKLLDFGLAKATGPPAADMSPPSSPTLTSPAVTQLGVMLGTAAYMAPEQAKGRTVDRRADVWAFGCVLYEMLVGVSPFAGESISEVIAAVLTKDVQWSALPPTVPASVRRLLQRCLERDPRRRLRDLGDALLELDTPDVAIEPVSRRPAPGGRRWLATGIAVIVVALAGAGAWMWPRRVEPRPIRAATIPDAGFLDFSTVAISPDGSQIAYYRDRAIGGGDLYVRKLDAFAERVLVNQVIALHPFFAPNGGELAYTSNEQRAIFKISLAGGSPVEVVRVAEEYPALWLDDGSIVVSTAHANGKIERGLSRVPSGGGTPVPLTTLGPGEELHLTPAVLPGRAVVFTVFGAGRHQLAVADLDKPGEHRLLSFAIDASTPKYTTSGHLLYFQPAEQQVIAIPFDPARREPTGKPVVVLTNVHRGVDTVGSFDVSREGHLFYTPQSEGDVGRRFGLTWAGAPSRSITEERASWAQPRLSPDGRRLLVRETATPNCTLWLYDIERGSRTRVLATDPHDPLWHPDGRRVMFSDLDTAGMRRVFSVNVDGTDPPVRVETAYTGTETPRSVSRDGTWLAVSRSTSKTGSDLWIVPLAGGETRQFAASSYAEDHAAFSPDGRWIAYTSNQSGRDEVYLRPWPAADEQFQVSTAGGTGAVWSGDGRKLAYSDGRRVVTVDIAVNPSGTPRVRAGTPQPITDGRVLLQRVGNYDLARDGKRLVIVEGSTSDARVTRDLRVMFNWVEELKRNVPAQ